MKDEHDFSTAKRGAVVPENGKTRITICLDDAIVEGYRKRADAAGKGFQTLINEALQEFLVKDSSPEEILRK